MRELAGDAYNELIGWDGKFAATLRALIARPGELTREFLEGRRTRYVSPVRLYLMCSLVYFIAAAFVAPQVASDASFDVGIGFGWNGGSSQRTPGEAALMKAMVSGLDSLTPQERADVDAEITGQWAPFQPVLRALARDAAGLQRRVLEIMPRALFLLIPALAAILAAFYRGRHFPDHLYFALHLQTFAFVVLALSTTVQYRAPIWLMASAQMAAGLWILVYAILAQRRVYGGSWLRTALKSAGAAAIYGILWATTSIAVTLWASRADY